MNKGHQTIAVHTDRCDGCGKCLEACAILKTGSPKTERSRIKLAGDRKRASFGLAVCRQCADPRCVACCPSGALQRDEVAGVVAWDEEKCVGCGLCTLACAYGGISLDPVSGNVMKCDLCEGKPGCVESCDRGALEFTTSSEIYNTWGELEDLIVPGISACLGCNSELLLRHTLRRIGPEAVLATPPGCIAGVGSVGYNGRTATKVPVFHPLLTNTASMLAGARRYYNRIGRDVTMVALAGDGGTADVGFQALSGAAEREEQMIYICVDNEGYMNTGVQRSGTTPYGSWTSTTPVGSKLRGKTRDAKPMALLMALHRCEYVATASTAFMDDYYAKLDKALAAAKRGMAYIHVFSPCPTGWRFSPGMLIEVARKAVESNMVPLWEYERETDIISFTRSVDQPIRVKEYLSLIGKFRHLDDEQVQHIQDTTDRHTELLKRFSEQHLHDNGSLSS